MKKVSEMAQLQFLPQNAQFGKFFEFVPGEKANRFIELLNNVKVEPKTFQTTNAAQVSTSTVSEPSKFQYNHPNPTQKQPSTSLQLTEAPNIEDNLSFISAITQVNQPPNQEDKPKPVSFKDESIICPKEFNYKSYFELKQFQLQ